MKKNKITIAGGGSTYTPGIIKALLEADEKLAIEEIRLYDIDAQRNDNMYVIIQHLLRQEGFKHIKLIQTLNPKVAFEGATFIFSQIRVGGMKMREKDEKICLENGLVGQETCGLGGFAYGMRTIGPILQLVDYIQEYAPKAWILNYTNPETIVSEAIRRKYPKGIRMINVCDMTISIEDVLSRTFGYKRENWIPVYYGLNHFGWYESIYDKAAKKDIMPELIQKIKDTDLENIVFNPNDPSWDDVFRSLCYMIRTFDSCIPNNYLEYYLYPEQVVAKTDKAYTRANQVMDGREKRTVEMANEIRNAPEKTTLAFDFGVHGEYIVEIAIAILNDLHTRCMIITENNGAIPNLRQDAVVEVPAYIGETGAEPIRLKPISEFHKGLMEAQVSAEKLLVDAYFENSYQKAFEAFTLNQTVSNASVAQIVLDEMIKANGEYWPKLN